MNNYEPIYHVPYPGGWISKSVAEVTEVTPEVLDQYDNTFVHIEDYLSEELPEALAEKGEVKTVNGQLPDEHGNVNVQGGGGGTSDYSDLSNKPSINGVPLNGNKTTSDLNIPTVTESTVTGWGFTKNTGTYSKPAGGIPEADLAAAVQEKLNSSAYELPVASDTVLGGVKVGENLTIDENGTLNAESDGTKVQDITWEEYQALPEAIKNNGTIYNITNSPDLIASPYNPAMAEGYEPGDYCIYEIGLYKCIGSTSGAWDPSKWTITTIAAELKALAQRIAALEG